MASEIAKLAASVLTNTVKIDDFLQSSKLPSPSFHEDGPIDFKLSPEVESARVAALEASLRLHDLLKGPVQLIRPTINAVSLEAIYKYDIASKVPIHGSIPVVELAKECNIYEPDLRRILRFAIIHHRVFQEPRKGIITHSAASRRLVDDSATRDGLGLQFDDAWQSFARTVEAMQKWPEEREPNKTGFSLAQNTSKSVFSYLEDHPSKAKRFAGAMTSLSTSPGHSPASLIHAYPWSSLGAKTIIDVGGSNGIYSIALAQSFPELKFVIQDLPAVISANTKNPIPVGLKDRVSFMPHDMFTPQPVVADVYMVRFVFHDWPDKHVVEILRNLIPALKPGARIIINDSILPEPGTLSELYERKIRALDMVMLSFFNSRERERDDWERVCGEVDPRFRFVDAWTPEGAALGIIEAVWDPEAAIEIEASSNGGMESVEGMKGMELDGREGVVSVERVEEVEVN